MPRILSDRLSSPLKTDDQGYITIATGKQKYLEMALNLALSIRLKDAKKISIICDHEISFPDEYKCFFDNIITLKSEDLIGAYANKLLLFRYSPYRKTMYIDSDCLVVRKSISYLWHVLGKYSFTAKGKKFQGGSMKPWSNTKKENVVNFMVESGIAYAVAFIGGSIYFNKSDLSKKIFDYAFSLYKERDFFG